MLCKVQARLLAAALITAALIAGCGGKDSAPTEPDSVETDVVALIEDACIFHVTEGVGIDDCYVGFERVEVTNCKERDPSDGGGKYDCIAEDLVTGERMNIRVIDAFDDLGEPDSSATAVNADDVSG